MGASLLRRTSLYAPDRILYTNQLITSPALAEKIATVVIHPSMLIARPLTRLPMIAGLFVMRMINSIKGGVEKP